MNFKNNAVPPSKKPLFPWYGNEYMMPQHPRRSVSLLTLFIVIICTFALTVFLFKNFDRISQRFSSSIESSTWWLVVGQDVNLSGMLNNDGDLIVYTHTLTLADATIVWLKSRTLDMNIYSGMVDVQWTVEREYNNMFIIEVTSISWALASTWTTWADLWSGGGMYISQAWIYLPPEFNQKYTLLNQWENGILKMQNLMTNQIVMISYFACKKSDPNKNCSQLQQNIWSSAEKIVSTSNGLKLYKLEGVTSRFFTNDDLYGYFINDVSEDEVVAAANAIILPTDSYLQHTRVSKLQSLCTDGVTSLMQIVKHSLAVDVNGLVMNMEWPTADGSATCKVFVDPSQAAGGAKISYISNTTNPLDTLTTTTTTSSAITLDPSVKQFPINLEKALTFTSSRGYSIVFPSSNISYESINVDESLDLPGVRCSTQMDIIKYSDKAMIHNTPAVSIYTCNIKGTLNNLGNSMIQKEAANGMKFLIKINDAAWVDFANNIQIN